MIRVGGELTLAYFIYKYQFSAQEVIAFMRIVRPGMVVGPQQQYMVANQMKWVGWVSFCPRMTTAS
jgi:cell division cycle 14